MTVQEAKFVDVLLDWVFSKNQHEPAKLLDACVQLAKSAHEKGGKWTPARVLKERW